MTPNHQRFMEMALEEARRGFAEGNQPVGTVIVRDGKVIVRGHNLATTHRDLTAHAETVALRYGGPSVPRLDFSGCTLYTTFEPCPMCAGAIMVAKVAAVVMGGRYNPQLGAYGLYSIEKLFQFAGWSSKISVVRGILVPQCEEIVEQWRQRQAH